MLGDARRATGDGNHAGDAFADGMSGGTCCTVTAPTFVNLGEGDLPVSTDGTVAAPPVDVSAYREVIVGAVSSCSNPYRVQASFREPGSSVFLVTQDVSPAGARFRVDGPTFKPVFVVNSVSPPCTLHYVIAGVGLN
jgi:hypothetical protein